MNPHIQTLLNGTPLTQEGARELFESVVKGLLSDVELTAALVALKCRGETAAELAGAARALRAAASHFPRPEGDLCDNCGTGGDGSHSINVSTAAAVVAATAGVTMVKHGNRSVSSQCGSADVLEALGVNIEQSAEHASRTLDQVNICFLFAPNYHPGIRHAMPVRRALKTSSIFNLLGPLVNPARPNIQLLGVYDAGVGELVAKALLELGLTRALVLHGAGLDELCLDAPNQAWLVESGQVKSLQIDARDLGLGSHHRSTLEGGSSETNKHALEAIFKGQASDAHRDVVALNAGATIWIAGRATDLRSGVEQALEILGSDAAFQHLRRWVEASHGA